MEKLYTVSKNKTGRWLWLRSWTPFAKFRLKLNKLGKTTTFQKREFQKNIHFCFINYAKAFDCVDHLISNYGKFFKRWEYQTTFPASWEIYMQVKKQHLELDMEQWTGSKLGKDSVI